MSERSVVAFVAALVLSIALVAAGCGDDDDGAAEDGAAEDGAAEEPGTGTITIGDLSWDLDVTRCVTLAGAIAADAVAVDEPDNVTVSISLSPEDWRDRPESEGWTANGTVRLDIDEPFQQWESGIEAFEGLTLPPGQAREDFAIESYDVADDGMSVEGEATFVAVDELLLGDPVEPTPGSFAITCPPA
ncbi:MAG: hypothetical protein ACE367_16400 [Acidimicrobiales bacterium]